MAGVSSGLDGRLLLGKIFVCRRECGEEPVAPFCHHTYPAVFEITNKDSSVS